MGTEWLGSPVSGSGQQQMPGGRRLRNGARAEGCVPGCEQPLQPKGCPGPRLRCGCRRRWLARAAPASHLLQHREYRRVSSGRSIPSAQVVGWLLPWQDHRHCSGRQQWGRADGAKETFGETSTSPPHFDAVLELQAEVWERGPKPLRAVDLMGWENCVIKRWDVAPVSYLFLSSLRSR